MLSIVVRDNFLPTGLALPQQGLAFLNSLLFIQLCPFSGVIRQPSLVEGPIVSRRAI